MMRTILNAKSRNLLTLLALTTCLGGCSWIECEILCERPTVSASMHNPVTGEKTLCGGVMTQNGEITRKEVDDLSDCVAEYAAKGFVLDRQSKPH